MGQYEWKQFASGFDKPVFLTGAGDGSGRVYIVEQGGLIWQMDGDAAGKSIFLDVSQKISTGGNEQGLLGLAFHPDYPQNPTLFINYTDTNGDTTISRFSVLQDSQKADPSSEKVLLKVAQPYANHNGGDLAFGPDGFLYIALGDGGSAGDPQQNAQNLESYLGKLLRIDIDRGDPYAIPQGNPFIGRDGLDEIWLYGLRNPWRFSFDRVTGDLYMGDVGQNKWEEIDFLPAGDPGGGNFGWNLMEGYPSLLRGNSPKHGTCCAAV